MKFLKTGLLLLITIYTNNLFAQTADEIISKHITAIGGKDKISQIKTIQIESNINIMGNDAPMTTTIVNGKGYKNELDFGGNKIIQVVTDKGGWMVNPMMGSTDPQNMPEEQYKATQSEIYVGGPLMDYASKGGNVELKGKEKIGNVDAYKIVLTGADKSASTFYFDPMTYYILKVVRSMNINGTDAETTASFSDYRKTDFGYTVPYSIETKLPQGITMTAVVNKVEVNKDIDPKIFDKPQ